MRAVHNRTARIFCAYLEEHAVRLRMKVCWMNFLYEPNVLESDFLRMEGEM